jgi:type IV pilus assembly protein PilW
MNCNYLMSLGAPVNKQKGLTLIEIMISLLLGVFLLGGVIGIFINTKQTYRVQDALSRLQENGRYAIEFIARDIRMTDYRACATGTLTSPDVPIEAFNNNAASGDSIDDGTDKIIVRWVVACAIPATPGPPATPATAQVTETINYSIYDDNLDRYGAHLIEGVEDMQISYGVDTDATPDGTPNYYADGGTAGLDLSKVVSIRVSLLLRTVENNIAAKPLPYTYNGTTVTPLDRRIRRVFSTTIALRNRIR